MTDFSVADHLDDRSKEALLELAKHSTIGSPETAQHDTDLLDSDQE
jgi:hypothetical protein